MESLLRILFIAPFFVSVGIGLYIFHYKVIPDMHRIGFRHPKRKDPNDTIFGQYYYWFNADYYAKECKKRGFSTKWYTMLKLSFIPLALSFLLAAIGMTWLSMQDNKNKQTNMIDETIPISHTSIKTIDHN